MRVGYIRISDKSQNTIRQEIIMDELNVEKVFVDVAGASVARRPQLTEMLNFVRAEDVCVVESISRLARSTTDLLGIVKQLTDKGVQLISQKENLDTDSPQGKFMLTIFAALAELEKDVTSQRRREGISAAKARGVYKGRVPIKVDWVRFETLYKAWKAGEVTAVAMQRELKLGARTFYRRVKDFEGRPDNAK